MVKNIGVVTGHFYGSIVGYLPTATIIESLQDIPRYDLIIFTGGADISPAWYGRKESNLSYGISTNRDATEISALSMAIRYPSIKILGICRGHQLINAYLGGELVEDLSELGESSHGMEGHKLEQISTDSIVYQYFSIVNSLHHQAVVKPGKGQKITSKVGSIIESTESERILTVQFHPEFMRNTEKFWEFIANKW